MGAAYVGPHCPHKDVRDMLLNCAGNIPEEADPIHINFRSALRQVAWKEQYKIMLRSDCPQSEYLILIFPHHPKKELQLLLTYDYASQAALNREINRRFQGSTRGGSVDLIIASGECVYAISGIDRKTTIYLQWAETANRTNCNGISNIVEYDLPILIHMDGYTRMLHALPLPAHLDISVRNTWEPIDLSRTSFKLPFVSTFLWVCESDPRKYEPLAAAPAYITREAALDECSDDTPPDLSSAICSEELPYDESDFIGPDTPFLSAATPRLQNEPFIGLSEEGPDEVPEGAQL